MLRAVRHNKESVLNNIRAGRLDAVHLSTTSLVDEIILSMHNNGILSYLKKVIPDKRKPNATIPFDVVLAISVASKMKVKSALSDVPFAIQDHRLLAELGYNLIDTDGEDKGIITEGSLRHLFGKYDYQDFFLYYNDAGQKHIMPSLKNISQTHILDCTKIEVKYWNNNYELSTVVRDSDGNNARGYKLATLRRIVGNTGVIEDIRFDGISAHDLTLSKDMLHNSSIFNSGDKLINDRGFLDRGMFNYMKNIRQVDTYIPLKTSMTAFEMAVSTAKYQNKWINHPNKKRKTQKITLEKNLKDY
jgi:hypothetical protein